MRWTELPGRLLEGHGRRRPRPRRALLILGLATLAGSLALGCEEPDLLVVELVANPEVNTREQVEAALDRVEVLLEAEGGFDGLGDAEAGDRWGRYEVTDQDDDGVPELLLDLGVGEALGPFALEPGHQEGKVLHITARGLDAGGNVAALGGASGEFRSGERTRAEVPFNLLPERRPLRVVSMSPPDGARDVEPPVESVTVELGGDVAAEDVAGHLSVRLESFGSDLEPAFWVSWVDTGLGRVTAVHFLDCPLPSGAYTVVVDPGLCSRTGQCLDQDLGLSGSQPYEGRFGVRGAPEVPSCAPVEVMATGCPEAGCPEGYTCEGDECVPEITPMGPPPPEPECDPALCAPPEYQCVAGSCTADCRLYGVCLDPAQSCDPATGLCE